MCLEQPAGPIITLIGALGISCFAIMAVARGKTAVYARTHGGEKRIYKFTKLWYKIQPLPLCCILFILHFLYGSESYVLLFLHDANCIYIFPVFF